MIVLYGPPGAGKTVQGQLLAKKYNWKWLSIGQILRDTHNTDILKTIGAGKLASNDYVDNLISNALEASIDGDKIVIDGFPREIGQAKWLIDFSKSKKRPLNLVVVLDVPEKEIMRRLMIRGRIDDSPDSIKNRLDIYNGQMCRILDYFKDLGIPIAHIDGVGTVKEISNQINNKLKEEKIL